MRDWQIRQDMYHKLNTDYSDDLGKVDIIYRTDQLDKDISDYITLPPEEMGWVYPAKSYIVALCYAQWLSEDFSEDLYDLLNYKSLLYNNDPYYKTFDQDQETYKKIIDTFGLPLPNTGVIPHIREYYLKEFLIKI